MDNIEQQVAAWFRLRLSKIDVARGYSITLAPERIFIDGAPPGDQGPEPFAEYDDDQGEWTKVDTGPGRAAILQYKVAVRLTVIATPDNYKAVARLAYDDVVRCCSIGDWEDLDKPLGIGSILADSWARNRLGGNYVDVAVVFVVRAATELRNRPFVPD
jgi:hypothetical protein